MHLELFRTMFRADLFQTMPQSNTKLGPKPHQLPHTKPINDASTALHTLLRTAQRSPQTTNVTTRLPPTARPVQKLTVALSLSAPSTKNKHTVSVYLTGYPSPKIKSFKAFTTRLKRPSTDGISSSTAD